MAEKKPDLKVVQDATTDDPKNNICADDLISLNEGYQKQETKIGSLQGSLRKEIGDEWKEREVHPKAMSHMRTGMKVKDERKRIHYFRSVLAVAGELLARYESEATEEMDFDEPKTAAE